MSPRGAEKRPNPELPSHLQGGMVKKPAPDAVIEKQRGTKDFRGPKWRPRPKGLPLVLETWLAKHPAIRDAIVWELESSSPMNQKAISYSDWSQAQKSELQAAYVRAFKRLPSGLIDPPPNQVELPDSSGLKTVLDKEDAWALFVNTVGWCLALETDGTTAWSMTSYAQQHLALLLDSRSMFWRNPWEDGYEIDWEKGTVVPAPPDVTFSFLESLTSFTSHNNVIVAVLKWCRTMRHTTAPPTIGAGKAYWDYPGMAPVSRIMEGTVSDLEPIYGLVHWTAGCAATVGFLRAVLRVANIPMVMVMSGNHYQPHFMSIDKYLSHGDDPYSWNLKGGDPPVPTSAMLISAATHNDWLGNADDEINKLNVGRAPRELALIHLTEELMWRYCEDVQNNAAHNEGKIWEAYKNDHTLVYLEHAIDLWTRLEARLAELGGCEAEPYFWSLYEELPHLKPSGG